MPETRTASVTFLEALKARLRDAAAYNPNTHVGPAAILWTDEKREWEALLPRLRSEWPELLTLGDYDPAQRAGPAIWLKSMIARALP